MRVGRPSLKTENQGFPEAGGARVQGQAEVWVGSGEGWYQVQRYWEGGSPAHQAGGASCPQEAAEQAWQVGPPVLGAAASKTGLEASPCRCMGDHVKEGCAASVNVLHKLHQPYLPDISGPDIHQCGWDILTENKAAHYLCSVSFPRKPSICLAHDLSCLPLGKTPIRFSQLSMLKLWGKKILH